jgi:hypothetical protein
MSLEDIWFTADEPELMKHIISQKEIRDAKNAAQFSDDLLNKFITMGIPALGKYKSGLFAEAGDIKVCLSIEVDKNQDILLHVCNLGDDGGLVQRLTFEKPHASVILKAFICDFPNAMFITPDFKRLCLFTKVEEKESKEGNEGNEGSGDNKKKHNVSKQNLSQQSNAEGPMSFSTFTRIILDNIRKPKQIIVAVQN